MDRKDDHRPGVQALEIVLQAQEMCRVVLAANRSLPHWIFNARINWRLRGTALGSWVFQTWIYRWSGQGINPVLGLESGSSPLPPLLPPPSSPPPQSSSVVAEAKSILRIGLSRPISIAAITMNNVISF